MKDFFDSAIDYNNYDHKISFDMIEKLYDTAMSYEYLLDNYNKYQKQIANLTEEDKQKIQDDPEFKEIQEKLNFINKFHNHKH